MLSYLYTGDYDQCDSADGDNDEQKGGNPSYGTPEPPAAIGFNNIKLYVTADKFHIESLKNLAKSRFIAWYKKYRGEKFVEVTRLALLSAPPHDRELREAVLNALKRAVDDEHERMIANDNLINVLDECGALKDMFKKVVTYSADGSRKYVDQMRALQGRVICAVCRHYVGWDEDQEWNCRLCGWCV